MGLLKFTKEEEKRIIVPLAEKLMKIHDHSSTTIIGMQGGQGTGKTTIVNFLRKELQKRGYKVASFSIDDFYTSWNERKKLQQKYPNNPFYQISRGMPGTHRIKELLSVLKKAKAGKPFVIPQFDKSINKGIGDISKKTKKITKKLDFLLFEGWCVGLPLVSSKELVRICNKNKVNLKEIDPSLKYHNVMLQYSKNYQAIWKLLNYKVMIRPPSLGVHKEWRALQERRLCKKKGQCMNPEEINHFIDIYLPLTVVCYEKIKPNSTIFVDKKHNYYKVEFISN
jgi:D-glycerate 3-kinase